MQYLRHVSAITSGHYILRVTSGLCHPAFPFLYHVCHHKYFCKHYVHKRSTARQNSIFKIIKIIKNSLSLVYSSQEQYTTKLPFTLFAYDATSLSFLKFKINNKNQKSQSFERLEPLVATQRYRVTTVYRSMTGLFSKSRLSHSVV